MYSGVQILSPRAYRDLPEQGDIIEHAYLRWLARGETVACVIDATPWHDAGMSLAHYLDTNLALTTGRTLWPAIAPSNDNTLIANGAHVAAGCELRNTVVGQGASIAAGLTLDEVVVWPGTKVERSLHRAIATPNGIHELPAE
jgi:NDP-sugar pyrophosphorylase family protein